MMKLHLKNIILLLLIFISIRACTINKRNLESKNTLIEALGADLKTWKDKDSISYTRLEILETNSLKDFTSLQTKDSLIQVLQNTVKKYKKELENQGSVTNFQTDTDFSDSSKAIVIYKDTLKVKDTVYIYPEYTTIFSKDSWINGSITANKSFITTDFKIRNEYSVIIGTEKGLFKTNKPFVEVINNNPYTEVKTLRAYQVSYPKQKRFGIGPAILVGFGKEGINTSIGVGLQYNIITF